MHGDSHCTTNIENAVKLLATASHQQEYIAKELWWIARHKQKKKRVYEHASFCKFSRATCAAGEAGS